MPRKIQLLVTPPIEFRTSNALLTSIAHIENNAVPVLFDGGSQVNTISTTMAQKFNLQTKLLIQQRRILFPNRQSTDITYYIDCLVITFPALRPNNEFIRLHFTVSTLLLDTHHEMILGIPFLRYYNVISHHCNGSMFLTTESGHHATIPLHVTRFMQPCRTPFCLVALATEPESSLPDIPPFQLLDAVKSPSTQLTTIPLPVATNSICAMTQPDDKPPIILYSAIEFWRHARAGGYYHVSLYLQTTR